MSENNSKIHITKALSSSLIMELMDENPNLEVITCSPSLYNRTSKKYIEILKSLDIEVKKEYNWGAKPKFKNQENDILNLAKKGFKAKEISEKLGIPISRVYHLVRKSDDKFKFNNYKRKYDNSKRELINSMKNEGKNPKEISRELNIPIRTVYYILNKK